MDEMVEGGRLQEREEMSSSETSVHAGSRSWKSRIQHVSLRTKLVVPLVAMSVLPVLAIGSFTISCMRQTLKERLVQRIEFETLSKARTFESFLQGLHRFVELWSDADPELQPRVEAARRAIQALSADR